MIQENNRQDVNGSSSKPYPQERNFVIQPDFLTESIGQGRTETVRSNYTPGGQAKYAVKGLGPSIYQDKTRYTKDDAAACEVSDGGKPAADNFPVSYEENQEGFGQ